MDASIRGCDYLIDSVQFFGLRIEMITKGL